MLKRIIIILAIIIIIIICITIFFMINVNLIKIDVASAFYPYAKELVVDKNIKLNLVSTDEAYKNILNGNVDAIIASAPSDEQKIEIIESGIELEFVSLYSEPLIFLVNKENSINNLNIEEIQEIYYSDTTNWIDFGGEDLTINTYQLEKNNGSQTAFESIVKNNILGDNHFEVKTMPGIIDNVVNDTAGICYTFYSYFSKMYYSDDVKILNINNEDIYSDDYPLLFEVYLIYRSGEEIEFLKDFI